MRSEKHEWSVAKLRRGFTLTDEEQSWIDGVQNRADAGDSVIALEVSESVECHRADDRTLCHAELLNECVCELLGSTMQLRVRGAMQWASWMLGQTR